MGLFGTIKKVGKGVLKGVGKVAKVAAPIVGLTGVGIPIAAGIGALGSVASDVGSGKKVSLKGALKHGAFGAAGGVAGKLGAGKALGGLAKKGFGALGGKAKGFLKDKAKSAVTGGLGGLLGGGGLKGALAGATGGVVGGELGEQAGVSPLASAGLMGLMLSERQAARKANEEALAARQGLLHRGLTMGEEQYASRAPLREQGMAALSGFFKGGGAGPGGMFRAPRVAGSLTPEPLPGAGPLPNPTPVDAVPPVNVPPPTGGPGFSGALSALGRMKDRMAGAAGKAGTRRFA